MGSRYRERTAGGVGRPDDRPSARGGTPPGPHRPPGDRLDPLGLDSFATHRLPLEEAPRAYEPFQKQDGVVKLLLPP
ncbi:MAG TPA: hypothetical protein VHA34_12075 [Actinomycetes bacterium]|nr:hypothetical protein [Actinomycetes bacterium]